MAKAEKNLFAEHCLTIQNRKKLTATGVSDVDSMDEKTVSASLGDRMLIIRGNELKVTEFSAENGNFCVEGEICSLSYSSALSRKTGIFGRLLK